MPIVQASDMMAAYFDWVKTQQADEQADADPIPCKATNEIYDEPRYWRHGL